MLFKCLLVFFALPLFARDAFVEPWGKDIHLLHKQSEEDFAPAGLATRVADAVIRFHQDITTKVAGSSHFRPTSSRYMQLAMKRYGFIKGFLMGCDRLMREDDEEWIYPLIQIDGRIFKYDPAWSDKYHYAR